ncbi:MAG TPA: hypothetical protein VGO25_08020 [Rhodanobacteraceae bacterium]|jgi:uncharacterized protein YndB with AHSA1/START domain|nr:hypothetical protein [Rhodanobacteraceae bacterium]
MNRITLAIALMSCLSPIMAHAEVKQSAADGFFLTFSGPVAASTAKAYADVTQIQRWWSSEHTYSGKAANLSIKPEAGGCFCERWKDGSAEHGRVVMALPGKLLRLETSLGPLQELALKGMLSFWIKTEDSATTLTVEYRVNGSSGSGLDQYAPNVDEVLGAQVDRLRRYIATGNPDAPVAPDTAKTDAAKTDNTKADASTAVKAKPAKPKTEKPPALPVPAGG